MARRPQARERLIDAFDRIVVDEGERSATLDAVAARAGVSKGGLLYHFSTRQELADASVERMQRLSEEGTQAMEVSSEGPARAYLRSSLWADTALDRSILTTSRLVQSGDQGAREAMLGLETRWYRMLEAELGDPVAAQAVLHMGDGLYQNAALGILADRAQDREAVMEQLLEALERLRPRG